MSDNHDLLNDKDVCSFEEHEAENVCSNKDAVACGDGCSDAVLWKIRKIGVLDQLILGLIQMQIKECGSTFGEKYERDI